MSELTELYQETIMDHNSHPRNFGVLENPTRQATGHNPLCGDQVTISLDLENDKIKDIMFTGQSCVICKSAASMLTAMVKGKSVNQAKSLFKQFHQLVTTDQPVKDKQLDSLMVFAGVRDFPSRVKCASLPWHTLNAALANEKMVTTE